MRTFKRYFSCAILLTTLHLVQGVQKDSTTFLCKFFHNQFLVSDAQQDSFEKLRPCFTRLGSAFFDKTQK
jgi:hypothetical protein